MANRVVLGKRGSDIGLFISKPGFDVLTTGINNMLFHSAQESLQFVQIGIVNTSNSRTATITIPNLGYWPMIFLVPNTTYGNFPLPVGSDFEPLITYNSNTSVTFTMAANATASIGYVVTRLRANG